MPARTHGRSGLPAASSATLTWVFDVAVTETQPRSRVLAPGALPVTAAHRGYSSVAPENTLAAYAAAMRAGSEYVEIDVHTTADDVPVVMHDQGVERTTNGTGDVASLPSGYVTGLEAGSWFSPAFAEQPTPTFQQALDLLETGTSGMLLEIKGPETREQVHRIVDMILAQGVEDRVIVQSFDQNVLRCTHERAPQLPIGLLGGFTADPVATARSLHLSYYNPDGGSVAARPSAVKELRAAGVGVFVWTVDSPDDWKRLAELGVDGIITNRPGAFIGWKAAQTQIEPLPEPEPADAPGTDGVTVG